MLTDRLDFGVGVVNDVFYIIGGYTRKLDADHFGDTITLYANNEQYLPRGYGIPDSSYDGSSPIIEIISPQERTFTTNNITLEFTINEPASMISYVLNNETAVEIFGNTTLPDVPYGSHNLMVYATDIAGNTGTSETVHFTITKPDNQDITLSSQHIAVAITIILVCIVLIIYLKKQKQTNKKHHNIICD